MSRFWFISQSSFSLVSPLHSRKRVAYSDNRSSLSKVPSEGASGVGADVDDDKTVIFNDGRSGHSNNIGFFYFLGG